MPPRPAGMDWVMWFDLSPMRPDEWAETDAARWNEAMQLRAAYQAGVEDAKGEAAMSDQLKQKAAKLAC